jgi:hypothetical protein
MTGTTAAFERKLRHPQRIEHAADAIAPSDAVRKMFYIVVSLSPNT